MKTRVWELDALRGICIIGVVFVHFIYDLTELYRIVELSLPRWYLFVQQWGGVLFLLISGICATLGSRSVRRGAVVLAAGFLITAVTWGMYAFANFDISIMIYFGVLHCLGCCMLLWPLVRRLPWWALAVLGVLLAAGGLYISEYVTVQTNAFLWLGLHRADFVSSDYFPLLPHFGFFLLGGAVGKTLYRKKETLLPGKTQDFFLLRFFRFCGRHSLWIYLIHQPVLNGLCWLLSMR